MPDPAQTPASRRFLPPSSVRNGPFVRPSQPSSSSPFARTPLPPSLRKDDIETSFEDDLDVPSSINQAVVTQKLGVDQIEDDGGNEQERSESKRSLHHHSSRVYKSDTSTKDRGSTLSPSHDFPSPLAKRQKVLHVSDTRHTPIQISSSPPINGDPDSEPDEDNLLDTSDAEDVAIESIDQVLEANIEETSSLRAKFRLPARDAKLMRGDKSRPTSHGVFKDTSVARDPWLEMPLPETFSPSKRKGKYDYVHGGMAETVRGWILDIAGKQEGVGAQQSSEMTVESVLEDKSGRFELVKDEKDEIWMLVDQESELSKVKAQTTGGSGEIATITLRGTGTVWQVNRPYSLGKGRNGNINVSTLWSRT